MAASCGDAWLDRVTGREKGERVDVVGVACKWTSTSALARTIRPPLSGDLAKSGGKPTYEYHRMLAADLLGWYTAVETHASNDRFTRQALVQHQAAPRAARCSGEV